MNFMDKLLILFLFSFVAEEDVDGGAFLLLTEDYLRLNFATIKSGERLKVLNLVEQFKLAPPHIFGEVNFGRQNTYALCFNYEDVHQYLFFCSHNLLHLRFHQWKLYLWNLWKQQTF